MYKTETHLHVSEVSPCAKISARDIVKLYYEAGYHTIFVSDHLKLVFFDKLGDIPWEEKTERFMQGYKIARAAGDEYGINVLFSAEFQFSYSSNHYLLYGIDKAFLDLGPDIFNMSMSDFYVLAKKHGITVIQAHPYRDGATLPADPQYLDAIEVINTNPRHDNFTQKAIEFAQAHDLPMTSGSDTHRSEDVALGGVCSQVEIKTAEDYVNLVMNRSAKLIGLD